MAAQYPNEGPSTSSCGVFATTHWSLVLAAGGPHSPAANEALENLCRTYWHPLYVFIRRRGYNPVDAEDLTQQFFAQFLEKNSFRMADPARGRFRTFLLRSLEHFLVNEWKRAHRLKQGGEAPFLSLDIDKAEQQFARELSEHSTPEQAYERRWAMILLERVLDSLRKEYAEMGRDIEFRELADHLWGKDSSLSYAEIGARLGISEGAARGAMHRLRERYRERLRSEVAQTVGDYTEVDGELRHLIQVVSQGGGL